MSIRKDSIYISAIALATLTFLCLFIAFCSPYWIRSMESTNLGFVRLGLWEVCFEDFVFPEDYVSKTYSGCWWVYWPEYNYIRYWLNPNWFYGIQVLATLSILLTLTVLLVLILKAAEVIELKNKRLDLAIVIFQIISLFATACVVVTMAAKKRDREWMPRPDRNLLSWSFAFETVGGFLCAASAITLYLRFHRDHYPLGYALLNNGYAKGNGTEGTLDDGQKEPGGTMTTHTGAAGGGGAYSLGRGGSAQYGGSRPGLAGSVISGGGGGGGGYGASGGLYQKGPGSQSGLHYQSGTGLAGSQSGLTGGAMGGAGSTPGGGTLTGRSTAGGHTSAATVSARMKEAVSNRALADAKGPTGSTGRLYRGASSSSLHSQV